MRETARDHTPMTALPYYHVAARAVPAITATPCGGYPPEKRAPDPCSYRKRKRRRRRRQAARSAAAQRQTKGRVDNAIFKSGLFPDYRISRHL